MRPARDDGNGHDGPSLPARKGSRAERPVRSTHAQAEERVMGEIAALTSRLQRMAHAANEPPTLVFPPGVESILAMPPRN